VFVVYPEASHIATRIKVHNKQMKRTEDGLALPIKNIKRQYVINTNVYCIEVAEEHSFIANGYAVHNCVSWATRNAIDVTRACEIVVAGQNEEFVAIGATEPFYWARGYSGDDGMSCSRAAAFASKDGGVLLRKKYGDIDLSTYSSSTAIKYGGRIPEAIRQEAKKHQVKTISLIANVEEARDAIANGYGIAVCSNQGFSSTRDSDGFCRASGSWAHGMAWTACDDESKRPGFVVQNSWGEWCSGGNPKWGKLPTGAFLIDYDVAQRMLNARGAFAFSNFDGWPAQDISSLGFETYLR
jgi:hypothetical protein